jgi:hypothetical protein
MVQQEFTQKGKFSVLILSPLLAFIIAMLFFSPASGSAFTIVMIFLIFIIVLCLLTFYKLTICIGDSYISFRMGAGLIKRKYALDEIEYCKPVRNSIWYGIGIHIIPGGWLYNVSGKYAIELGFRSRKKISIGTDKPDEIAQIINERLGKQDSLKDIQARSHRYVLLIILGLLFSLIPPAVVIYTGTRETRIEYHESYFKIRGLYGISVNYSEINRVDTLNSLPQFKARTNGILFGKVLRGHFRMADQTDAIFYVTMDITPYICIRTSGGILYLNLHDSPSTRDTFNKISKMMEK